LGQGEHHVGEYLLLAARRPRITGAEVALRNGDCGPRMAMWSRTGPLTLFGAAISGRGRRPLASPHAEQVKGDDPAEHLALGIMPVRHRPPGEVIGTRRAISGVGANQGVATIFPSRPWDS